MKFNQEKTTSRLFNEWAESERGENMAKGHDQLLEPVVSSWELNETSSVLDIGCGVGRALLRMKESGVGPVSGIDLSPGMIEAAKQKLPEADLRVGSVLELPWEEDSFSHVLSIEVLYYLKDPLKGLKENYRVLKPGGTFSSVIEYFEENEASWVWEEKLPMNIKRWTSQQWVEAFKTAGFNDVLAQRIIREDVKTETEFQPSNSFPSYEMYRDYVEQGALWVQGIKLF